MREPDVSRPADTERSYTVGSAFARDMPRLARASSLVVNRCCHLMDVIASDDLEIGAQTAGSRQFPGDSRPGAARPQADDADSDEPLAGAQARCQGGRLKLERLDRHDAYRGGSPRVIASARQASAVDARRTRLGSPARAACPAGTATRSRSPGRRTRRSTMSLVPARRSHRRRRPGDRRLAHRQHRSPPQRAPGSPHGAVIHR